MKLVRTIVFLSLAGATVTTLVADDGDVKKQQAEKWSNYFYERALKYDIQFAGADGDDKLELVKEPLLHWANPLRATTHGKCYVWTHEGRPEVFVSLFSYPKGANKCTVAHAFNTFSDHPLVAKFDDEVFWTPKKPGTAEMKMVPDSPVVAGVRGARMVQMRNIVRKFSATAGGTKDEERELRLLTTPLYRYPKSDDEYMDGALFGFVMGTDPEVILMLESRIVDSEPRWHYLAVRHTFTTLRVSFEDTQVWMYERGKRSGRAIDHIYRSQHGVDSTPRMLP